MIHRNIIILLICICHSLMLAGQSENSNQNQSLKDKNVLIVWGGWDGHQPDKFAKRMSAWAKDLGAKVLVSDSLGVYANPELMARQDLIIQYWTMGEISKEQCEGLIAAVKNGTPIVGCHGGLGDSFRNNTEYQYMIGGQWVSHPGGKIDYTVQISNTGDPVTKDLVDFDIKNTEQYYMHVDPNVRVLATTTFNADHDDWIAGNSMPVVWKKRHDKGRIFYMSIGHNPEDFDHPSVWTMLTRGIDWAVYGD